MPMPMVQTSFELERELRDELDAYLEKNDIVKARLMRRLIKDFLLANAHING